MTIEITNTGSAVQVVYIADGGGQASAVVVGGDKEDVEERKEEIVDSHNLRDKAESTDQS